MASKTELEDRRHSQASSKASSADESFQENWQHSAPAEPWWNVAWEFIRSNPKTKLGRAMQIVGILVFAIIATAGIVVQVYTDAEITQERLLTSAKLNELNAATTELYAVANLLMLELEPFYEFNVGPYDIFLERSQQPQRNLDNRLIFAESWPTDFSALGSDQRVNITTTSDLRGALRSMRDARKAVNGTPEADIIRFYSNTVDYLAILARTNTLTSQRFPGWQEFLSTFYTFQIYINFKKYALIGRKLVATNRSVDIGDPVYASIVSFYFNYIEFTQITALTSIVGFDKIQNLTDQEPTKNVERIYNQYIGRQDFITIDINDWIATMNAQDSNILWIFNTLQRRARNAMDYFAGSWPSVGVVSLGLFVASAATVFFTIFAHFASTWRIQNRIIESHATLDLLADTLSLLYDCMPRSFIKQVKAGNVPPVRFHSDACIVMLDLCNTSDLMHALELEDFTESITEFFEIVEQTLVKYNCCKMEVHGELLALAAGIGERHAIDHVAEMLFVALELHDRINERNVARQEEDMAEQKRNKNHKKDGADRSLLVKIGIHIGQCYVKILQLRTPTVGLFGETPQIAALLHSTCLPMCTQVSKEVRDRLGNSVEVEFKKRGRIDFSSRAETEQWSGLEAYWAKWTEDDPSGDMLDGISLVSSRKSLLR